MTTNPVRVRLKTLTPLERHRRFYRPREMARSLVWFREHVRNTDGRPYSHEAYPHLGAPGGPCDAMDDGSIRKIWLQFASRLGKTFFGQCSLLKKTDCNPGPMMFASAVEKSAVEVTERTYRMLELSPKVCDQLPPKRQRRQSMMRFDACECPVAWARSVATLADKEVEFGHANEIDKWEHLNTSKEAHPLKLFTDRLKNRPHHKAIFESTPAEKGKSKIEAGRLGSSNCKLWVPCPHCEQYQTLKMKSDDGTYRMRWDTTDAGKSDKDLARRTAEYLCEHCGDSIEDHHRPAMMRAGVWCPEGCTVRGDAARAAAAAVTGDDYAWHGWSACEWIDGTPTRDGPEAGYHLSSLYALSLTWGDIAAEFVSSMDKPQELRNFVNQWLADTWERIRRKMTWENFAIGVIDSELPRGLVPGWASILTCGIDRQDADGSRFPWCVDAWGPGRQCHTIAYGEAETLEELETDIIAAAWQHEDGRTVQVGLTLVDSGYKPLGVYEFCGDLQLKGFQVWPVKGSNTAMDADYRYSILGPTTSSPGTAIFLVDTTRTQNWLEHQLGTTEGVYSIYAGSTLEHQDFCEQLLNDAAVDKLDKNNNLRQNWERINTGIPNDMRDVRRYAYVAMLIATRGRDIPSPSAEPTATKSAVLSTGKKRGNSRW